MFGWSGPWVAAGTVCGVQNSGDFPARPLRELVRPHPVQVPGQHLFVWSVEVVMADPAETSVQVRPETIVGLSGPGCRWCGRLFEVELAEMPCPGEVQD